MKRVREIESNIFWPLNLPKDLRRKLLLEFLLVACPIETVRLRTASKSAKSFFDEHDDAMDVAKTSVMACVIGLSHVSPFLRERVILSLSHKAACFKFNSESVDVVPRVFGSKSCLFDLYALGTRFSPGNMGGAFLWMIAMNDVDLPDFVYEDDEMTECAICGGDPVVLSSELCTSCLRNFPVFAVRKNIESDRPLGWNAGQIVPKLLHEKILFSEFKQTEPKFEFKQSNQVFADSDFVFVIQLVDSSGMVRIRDFFIGLNN